MENTNQPEKRVVNSLQFGELTVESNHIFKFDEGLLGFEDLREFVLISDEETLPFKWLINLEKPEIGFPLLSPWHIDWGFEMTEDYDIDKQVIYVVVTLGDEKGLMTANMKAPIILDVSNQSGRQTILPSDKYSPTFPVPKT